MPQNEARTKKINRKGTTLLTKFMVIYSENGEAQPKRSDIFHFTGHCQNRAGATKLYSSDAWVSNFPQQTEQMTRARRGRKLDWVIDEPRLLFAFVFSFSLRFRHIACFGYLNVVRKCI